MRYDVAWSARGTTGSSAAAYLARAGLRVVVLERRDVLGGACVTEELWPGYRDLARRRTSPGCCGPAVVRELGLARRGLRAAAARPFVVHAAARRARRCCSAGAAQSHARLDRRVLEARRRALSRATRRSSTASRAGSSRCSTRRRPIPRACAARDLRAARGARGRRVRGCARDCPERSRSCSDPRGPSSSAGSRASRCAQRSRPTP